jgi:hypothetical protein
MWSPRLIYIDDIYHRQFSDKEIRGHRRSWQPATPVTPGLAISEEHSPSSPARAAIVSGRIKQRES